MEMLVRLAFNNDSYLHNETNSHDTAPLVSSLLWLRSHTWTGSASRSWRRRSRATSALTKIQMGFVFSVFAGAYAAFEIVTAWWGERIGPRSVLTRIVTWWSCFTIATPFAWSYSSLLVIRFLFGAGEAGA
jgi:MFS family permease